MVLESLFDIRKIMNKPINLFILAMFISFVGILTSFLLFPEHLGIMSVAFISLLLFPLLHGIFECSSKNQFRNTKVTFKSIFRQHIPIFKVFFILMLAIFVVFLFLGFVHSPDMTSELFGEQLSFVQRGLASGAMFDFNAIAQNNLRVMYITFSISLIYGAGVVIMLSWNASVWGIVIGSAIRKGMEVTGSSALTYIATNLLQIFPHLVLESIAYLGAAISGGLLAMCAVFQKIRSKRFLYTLTDSFFILVMSILLILISAVIEINI